MEVRGLEVTMGRVRQIENEKRKRKEPEWWRVETWGSSLHVTVA
jgi:hypothetical protein